MDAEFLKARIEATKLQIIAYEGVLDEFAANGGLQSYTLDTGQSTQTVTRSQLSSIRLLLDGLYNRLATLEARLNGGSIIVRPVW